MVESHNVSDKTWIAMLHGILMRYCDIKTVNNAYPHHSLPTKDSD